MSDHKIEGVVSFPNGPDKHISYVATTDRMVYFKEGGSPVSLDGLEPAADGKPYHWEYIGHQYGKKA